MNPAIGLAKRTNNFLNKGWISLKETKWQLIKLLGCWSHLLSLNAWQSWRIRKDIFFIHKEVYIYQKEAPKTKERHAQGILEDVRDNQRQKLWYGDSRIKGTVARDLKPCGWVDYYIVSSSICLLTMDPHIFLKPKEAKRRSIPIQSGSNFELMVVNGDCLVGGTSLWATSIIRGTPIKAEFFLLTSGGCDTILGAWSLQILGQ